MPEARTLFEVPIGPVVASFFAMSAIAHLIVAFPARGWYERRLARRQNPARWIEYAFSSSVMIVVIAMLTGIREVGTLIGIVGANAAMNLFGWSMEAANEGRDRPQWLYYVFGCIAGIVPWLVISVALLTGLTAPDAAPIPGFVIAIYVSLFLSFNVFALNMVFQFLGDRSMARLPVRRAGVHVPEPVRQDPAGLAGLVGDAAPLTVCRAP